jgi:hypothetical protein
LIANHEGKNQAIYCQISPNVDKDPEDSFAMPTLHMPGLGMPGLVGRAPVNMDFDGDEVYNLI